MKKRIIGILLALILVFSTVGLTAAGSNTIIYVDDDNTSGPWDGSIEHPYNSVQDGIDHAENGDEVFVFSGTYHENIIIDKSLTLSGEDKDTTCIDADERGFAISIEADRATVSSFTIQRGGSYESEWAGITIYSDHNVISENIIANNRFYGIYLVESSNNIILNNRIYQNGAGGISFRYSSNNTINENIIGPDNVCGIRVDYYSHYNSFDGNHIFDNDKGMMLSPTSIQTTIVNNSFLNDGLFIKNFLDESIQHVVRIVSNNTVNEKELLYLENRTDECITNELGQIILADCNNITIKYQNIGNTDMGIGLFNTNNCSIAENEISCNFNNIVLYDSTSNHLCKNKIHSNASSDGILLSDSDGNEILNNTITDTMNGINISSSQNNTITQNNLSLNHQNGISVHKSSGYNKIIGNTISSNMLHGIDLKDSNSMVIEANILKHNGLFADSSFRNVVNNNSVNGKDLVYLQEATNVTITEDAGQIILFNCTHITVEGQVLSHVHYPLYLINTRGCLLSHNVIGLDTVYGIFLKNSENNSILNNTISENEYGLFLNGGSNQNEISNNQIAQNNRGIHVDMSDENIISKNYLVNNTQGIWIIGSSFCMLSYNHMYSNYCGLHMENGGFYNDFKCRDTSIRYNAIEKNSCGISLTGNSNTDVNYNNFLTNSKDLIFKNTESDDFNYNYWDAPRLFPKPIHGSKTVLFFLSIPMVKFDWQPAAEPYDIDEGDIL